MSLSTDADGMRRYVLNACETLPFVFLRLVGTKLPVISDRHFSDEWQMRMGTTTAR